MILKNLLRRKTRTLLTLVGIAIGIAAIVALGALAEGLAANYTSLLSGSEADLILSQSEGGESAVTLSVGAVDEEIGRQVARFPEVKEVAGMSYALVPMPGIPYFVLFGYDPAEFAIGHFKIVEGEMLEPGGRRKEIILGRLAADNLDRRVGDTVKVSGGAYRVVGIYETGTGFEDNGAVVPLSEVQAIFKQPHNVSAFLLRLKDIGQLEAARSRIERRFPDLSVSRTSEVTETLGMIETARSFAWAVSLIAILVGGVGMMNTMLMSVLERTREIGVLRALGWRKGRVLGMVLGESLTLSLIGGAAGMALGVFLVKVLGRVPAVGSLSRGAFTPGLFLQALSVSIIMGALGGLYPAYRASRLMPVEALRYEGGRAGAETRLYIVGGMAVKNLLRRKARTLLTILGVGIGVMAVVAMGGFTEGFIEGFSAMATETDLMVIEADVSDLEFSAIEDRVGKRIAAIPGVKHVLGGVIGLATPEKAPYFIVWGYHPYEHAIRHFKVAEGRGLEGSREMIIGRMAAEELDKGVGDRLRILGTPFRIVGIYETGNAIEEHGGVISLREAQNLFGKKRRVSFYAIKVVSLDQVEEVKRRIEERFPELAVTRSAEFAESTPDMQMTRTATDAIFFLTALVGAVGLMDTMVMSVFERTREIGVLRALGWRKGRILGLILRESLLLGLISGLMGLALGWVLIRVLGMLPIMVGLAALARFTPGLLARALGMALALGALGGLYPAWRASRLRPVEALRYE